MTPAFRIACLALALLLPLRAQAICSNSPLFWKIAGADAGAAAGVVTAMAIASSSNPSAAHTGNFVTDAFADVGEYLGTYILAFVLGAAIGGTGGWLATSAFVSGPGKDGCTASTDPVGRNTHPYGLYVTAFGDPYPSQVGLNVAYNADFARVHLGVGKVSPGSIPTNSSLTSADLGNITGGAGISFLIPKWRISPIVGVHIGSLPAASSTGSVSPPSGGGTAGTAGGGVAGYLNLGVDWQGKGLNAGAGIDYVFSVSAAATTNGTSRSLTPSGVLSPVFPYLYLGYYF